MSEINCCYEFIKYLKEKLPKKSDRKFLIKYIAQMCEKSYRRGAHHAVSLIEQEMILKKYNSKFSIYKWRQSDITKSKGLCGYNLTTIERFLSENREWESL